MFKIRCLRHKQKQARTHHIYKKTLQDQNYFELKLFFFLHYATVADLFLGAASEPNGQEIKHMMR